MPDSEDMDLEGESTMAALLKQHNSQLHSKYMSLYPQRSVILSCHQRNFFLQQLEITAENHIQSKCSVVEPSTSRYIYTTLLNPRLRQHCGRREGKPVRAAELRSFL